MPEKGITRFIMALRDAFPKRPEAKTNISICGTETQYRFEFNGEPYILNLPYDLIHFEQAPKQETPQSWDRQQVQNEAEKSTYSTGFDDGFNAAREKFLPLPTLGSAAADIFMQGFQRGLTSIGKQAPTQPTPAPEPRSEPKQGIRLLLDRYIPDENGDSMKRDSISIEDLARELRRVDWSRIENIPKPLGPTPYSGSDTRGGEICN